jgi:hypothetical protein
VRIGVHPDARDLSNANRALERLARIGGFMVDKKEFIPEINLRSLSRAELREVLDAEIATLAPAGREWLLLQMPAELVEVVAEPTTE